MSITQKEVKEIFGYKDGKLFWKVARNTTVKVGDEVGYTNNRGYRVASIFHKNYYVHRIIWLWHYGYSPENQIDHINRNPGDNKIENLREVSPSCNLINRGLPKNNQTGVKGVYRVPGPKGWRTVIKTKNKIYHIGIYSSLLEASCHRLAAEQFLNWAGCDSSSPAFQYVKKHIPHIK